MTDQQMIDEARGWLGTPWIHNQALKGVGADCILFILAWGQSLGLVPKIFKRPRYNRDWALHNAESVLLMEIQKHARKVKLKEMKIGDVVFFKYGQCTSHAAIYIGLGKIIHSVIRQGVIESNLKDYMDKFDSVWRSKLL